MRALVTGATGFIGGALASALAELGWDVRVLIRPSSRCRLPSSARFGIFEAQLGAENFWIEGERTIREAMRDCDVVFHAAAIRNRWGTPLTTYRLVHLDGTRHLLEAARDEVQRFVYISSVGVLGQPGVLGIDESFPVTAQAGEPGYHSTKAEAEQLVLARSSAIEAVIVRPTITYGPGDQDGMLTRLIRLLACGRFIRVGNGRNHFHLTYIDDLVQGLILAATQPAAVGQVFILAGPQSIPVRELIDLVARSLEMPGPASFFLPEPLARSVALSVELLYKAGSSFRIPHFQGVPLLTRGMIDTLCRHRGYSSNKAERLLGYRPHTGYAEGVEKTINWMQVIGSDRCLSRLTFR